MFFVNLESSGESKALFMQDHSDRYMHPDLETTYPVIIQAWQARASFASF